MDVFEDQGAGPNVMSRQFLLRLMKIDPSISSSELSSPRLLGTFKANEDGVLCKMEVVVDALIEIIHGSGLLLRGVSLVSV